MIATWNPAGSERAPVGRVRATLNRLTIGSGHIGCLAALIADHDVKLDGLTFANAAQQLLWVVARDGRLVDEDVLVSVVAVDEAIAVLDIKPLHRSQDPLGDDRLLPATETTLFAHCQVGGDLRKGPGAGHSCWKPAWMRDALLVA